MMDAECNGGPRLTFTGHPKVSSTGSWAWVKRKLTFLCHGRKLMYQKKHLNKHHLIFDILTYHDMIFLDCYHSDSLTGYSFSHEGWWSDGFVLKQHVDNASECANLCNTKDDCIAFNYRYGDDKQCVGYKSLVSKQCAQELVGHMLNASVCLEKFGYLVTFILYILTR